jgi:two-component system, sensor histidine kinase ChiS
MYLFAIIIGAIFSRNKELLEIERAQTTEIIKSLNKDLEDKIRERTSDLQKALSTKTEFLNNMSHEIRTPVHGFTAISEGLVDLWSSLGDDKKYKYVVEIANNASRLSNLLTDLLDMSKFTANKMSISLKKVNLNELVDAVVTECKELYLKNKPINIIFNSSKKNIVNVDKSKIEQVLRNLLTNSIKFTPENGNIEIIIKSQAKLTKVTIIDSGVGIPEKELKEIFEVFTQSSKTKTNAGGTGLGLSISKNIIELHNGRIWASNNDNVGSSFCFTIPRVKIDS